MFFDKFKHHRKAYKMVRTAIDDLQAELLGVKAARIAFGEAPKRRSLRVGGVSERLVLKVISWVLICRLKQYSSIPDDIRVKGAVIILAEQMLSRYSAGST
jgi:hypothetical protein